MYIANCILYSLEQIIYNIKCYYIRLSTVVTKKNVSCQACHLMKIYNSLMLHPSCLLNKFESLRTSLHHMLASLVQKENIQKIDPKPQPKV